MLKETETEKKTIVFFVTFLSLVAFQLGGPGPLPPPLTTSMGPGSGFKLTSFHAYLEHNQCLVF